MELTAVEIADRRKQFPNIADDMLKWCVVARAYPKPKQCPNCHKTGKAERLLFGNVVFDAKDPHMVWPFRCECGEILYAHDRGYHARSQAELSIGIRHGNNELEERLRKRGTWTRSESLILSLKLFKLGLVGKVRKIGRAISSR